MKYLRYSGEFLSKAGVAWRADIYQESESAYSAVGDLNFEASEPLTISWERRAKHEVLCGAIATLQIDSPGDRTYEDLYAIEIGSIRLDVYRNDALYWSGVLDPEFYEEPYEREKNYAVTLTFSDFGILSRLKYNSAGMLSICEILTDCIARSYILNNGIDETLISTSLDNDDGGMSLADIKVRSDNFYDEDGEASTLSDVIVGLLQPLALRMMQRNGKIYIYDLNALYNAEDVQPIEWSGQSSTMSADSVYNNAKITWSTYAQSGNLLPEKCWGSIKTPAALVALNDRDGVTLGDATYYSYQVSTDLADWKDGANSGFTIWVSDEGENLEIIADHVKYYRIVPQYDGSESEGIAICFTSISGSRNEDGSGSFARRRHGVMPEDLIAQNGGGYDVLFKTPKVWLPPVDSGSNLLIRAVIKTLIDPRFNPFEDAANIHADAPQKDWYNQWQTEGNFVYVPVVIKYQPTGSDTVYFWSNKTTLTLPSSGYIQSPCKDIKDTYGSWRVFSESAYWEWWGKIAYYDVEDRKTSSGVLGWKDNRSAINPHNQEIRSTLMNAEPGQYTYYPDIGEQGGQIWMEVLSGEWQQIGEDYNIDDQLWSKLSWVLMQPPRLEIINGTQFDQEIDTADVEYSAEINSYAKEELSIDTICGSSVIGVPTARGAYYNVATGGQIKEMTRAGRTTQVEDLLCGTLYSQYAVRRTALSGEVDILTQSIISYTEANQPNKLFLLVEDRQDLIADTSNAVLIEFRPDEYTAQNGEEI